MSTFELMGLESMKGGRRLRLVRLKGSLNEKGAKLPVFHFESYSVLLGYFSPFFFSFASIISSTSNLRSEHSISE